MTAGCALNRSVMADENRSLSTASAEPAGTLVWWAAAMMIESSVSISRLRIPEAFSVDSALNELLQTSSAIPGLACAGENFVGFIS